MKQKNTIQRALIWARLLLLAMGLALGITAQASTDYAPAVWRPCYSGHWYTSGYGHKFHVIHDIEGYYLSAISYFQKSTTKASVHYFTNGKKDYTSDANAGEVSQGVRDAYYAWHALCWNQRSTGNEHEGFVSNPAWFTEALYAASAGVTRHLQAKFGWPMDRNHVVGHDAKKSAAWASYCEAYFGVDAHCNSHTDPGSYWNWTHYMDLCKGTTSAPTAPSTLTAVAYSSSQINLKWADRSSNESGFKIERGTAAAGPFTQIATASANAVAYNATGLTSGTTYYFRVRAYNSGGNSAYSNVASAMTKDTIPAAPSALTATAMNTHQINLAWTDNSANEDGFRIFRSNDSTNYTQVATVGINIKAYSDTTLTGNHTYWYKVVSYNTAGNSAYSAVASDITAPEAPTALSLSTGADYSQIVLAWTDNSSSEVGFKVERSVDGTNYTQIATPIASVRTYTDTGRAALTKYYYRVRSYNGNGNSDYSNVASFTTPRQSPVLQAIGNKAVPTGSPLTFTAAASNPNQSVTTTTWQTFESYSTATPDEKILFKKPANSATTSAFLDSAATNYTLITSTQPAGNGSAKCLKAGWSFKTGVSNYWVRLNTYNTTTNPNPAIALDQVLRFKVYCNHTIRIGLGCRETGTTAAYGADGGTTGTIDWAGVTNVVNGYPMCSHVITPTNWTTVTFNIPFEKQAAFTGDGVIPQNNLKGVMEHLAIVGNGGAGSYVLYLDDFAVVATNTLSYTLDSGAPAGASIGYRTGAFKWTPSAGQAGNWNITVRVTDRYGMQDFETIKVTVSDTNNIPPILAPIGNKTVDEMSLLTFTAAATDQNIYQTLTYSLDAGAPAGASIDPVSGVFTWTPTESQGPGSYPITVRVTDNGIPTPFYDTETVTVTVNDANIPPVIAPIANQTVNELSPMSLTVSASDVDLPANSFTWSLEPGAPAGMTINPSSGVISWTPSETQGPDIHWVTVTVRDNGVPSLYDSKTFNVTVLEANIAPVLTLGTSSTNITTIADFENEDPDFYNGVVLFRQPTYSGTTSGFLATSPNNTSIDTDYPDIDVNTSAQVLHTSFAFKTGTTNAFVRLTSYSLVPANGFGAYVLPNPTIDLGARVRFKIWVNKSMKVALGIRETATGAPLTFNGGYTGDVEWVGSTATKTGGCPTPTRTVNASNWTTLEFNLPSESCSALTGNGVLAAGKGTLEDLALVPNAGLTSYEVYLDDFQIIQLKTNSTFTIDPRATISVKNTATDADVPANSLSFSLDAGAPEGAAIDPETGIFTWTPTAAQSGTTNLIPVRVTDDGSPAMSNVKNLTVIVNKVNTPPTLAAMEDMDVEVGAGTVVTFTAEATDDDLPAQTLTYSLVAPVPAGAVINGATGVFTWSPPSGTTTNVSITVRVTDNGSPILIDDQIVSISVVPANTAPTLTLGTARIDEPIANFESFGDGVAAVMFNAPGNSSATSAYVDAAQSNSTVVATSFPANHSSSNVLKAEWSFNAGLSNYWVCLNTRNTPVLPNPTIDLAARVKFDIYTTKALLVGLGIRETATTTDIGANGGSSGTLEYVGCTNMIGLTPMPNRAVAASNWVTLEFNLPAEAVRTFDGDGVLAAGKGVLDHLILVGNGGTGAYTVYLDNFDVVWTAALPGTVNLNTGSTISFTASATDPNPGSGLSFGLDADANPGAILNSTNGAFSWTPGIGDAGTSNSFTVSVQDSPTSGVVKTDEKTFSVIVNADPFGPLSSDGFGYVAEGETVTLSWDAVVGASYTVQFRASLADGWKEIGTVTATARTASMVVSGEGQYRVISNSSPVQDQ